MEQVKKATSVCDGERKGGKDGGGEEGWRGGEEGRGGRMEGRKNRRADREREGGLKGRETDESKVSGMKVGHAVVINPP